MASTAETVAHRMAAPPPATALPYELRSRPPWKRWLGAVLFLAAAFAISVLLREQITRTLFVFFFGAIALTAWYSGLMPSLVVVAASILLTNYYLIEPVGSIRLDADTFVMSLMVSSIAVFISYLTSALASTREALAMHAEQLQEQAGELEAQVEESQMLTEELEATNVELEEVAENAQAANQAKGKFLAVMSHELRTPLNAIIGYADLLHSGVSGPINETQMTQLSRIRASSFHLLDLIQDVLSFSRIEAGREELRLGDIDVQQIVRDALTYVEEECRRKGLVASIAVPEENLVMITDPARLRQILLNLLTNACKFTESGSVHLAVARDREDVTFTVSDTGPGIAQEHLELIFEPFTQVDQSMTRQKGGAGLGLPVSRRLAHLLGGELLVDSVAGRGSTFTLRLPLHARLK